MQVVPGQIWTFEQEQSLVGINVATTVRMTAIKLKSGGMLLLLLATLSFVLPRNIAEAVWWQTDGSRPLP